MRRNLLAIFLTVMVVCALVFFVAPSAKAEDSNTVNLVTLSKDATGENALTISTNTVLDLAGFDATVSVAKDVTLSVIDTSFMVTDENGNKCIDFSGDRAGELTVATGSEGTISTVYQNGFYHYLKVANKDEDGNLTGTYSFHPFNMDFTAVGINTLAGEDDNSVAICLRATFIGNNVVKNELTDYGVYNKTLDKYIPVQGNYPFDKNGVHAYCDLPVPALDSESIDTTNTFCVYMQFGEGESAVFDYSASRDITPREVLKDINKQNLTPTDAQKTRLMDLIGENNRVANILTNLQVAQDTATLSFADTTNRTEFSTIKQVWSQNGITFINEKANSTNNVADYSNPVRLYKSSTITIGASGITTIEFDCNSSSYASALATSIGTVSGGSVTTSSDEVTVVFTSKVDTFTVTLSEQIRIDSITITADFAPECTHNWHTEPSCTKEAICLDCDVEIGKAGHVEGTAANCTTGPICENCAAEYDDPLGHDYVDGRCTRCSIDDPNANKTPVTLATFEFGADGTASHKDNNTKQTTYTETDGDYTLNLTDMTNAYPSSYDAAGNSCIKFGTSSKTGSFTLTVPENVTSVVIYVAQYKANTTKIAVNGTSYTITTASNNGEYTAITIDTSTTKDISFTTVSGGVRAMLNAIEFIGYAN